MAADESFLSLIESRFNTNLSLATALIDEVALAKSTNNNLKLYLKKIAEGFVQLSHKAETLQKSNTVLKSQVVSLQQEASDAHSKLNCLQLVLENLEGSQANQHDRRDFEAIARQHVLRLENTALRQELFATQSEREALRLTAKYLDQERAGRVQQLQLVLKNDLLSPMERDRVWYQLESEIALHRTKAIAARCLVRVSRRKCDEYKQTDSSKPELPSSEKPRKINFIRRPGDRLGIAICGGRTHVLPVIVAMVDDTSPLKNKLFVGDVIDKVNGIDLSTANLKEAAAAFVDKSDKGKDFELLVRFLGRYDDLSRDQGEDRSIDTKFLQAEEQFFDEIEAAENVDTDDSSFFFPIELPAVVRPKSSSKVPDLLLKNTSILPFASCMAVSLPEQQDDELDQTNPFANCQISEPSNDDDDNNFDPLNPFSDFHQEPPPSIGKAGGARFSTKGAEIQNETADSDKTLDPAFAF